MSVRFVRRVPVAMRLLVGVLILTSPGIGGAGPAAADTAPTGCVDDAFQFYTPSGPAQARVCIVEPASGPVTGTVTVTATLSNIGAPTSPRSQFAARRMVFTLDGQDLLTDYQAEPRASVIDPSVYTFTLDTRDWVDGDHVLSAHAVMGDTLAGPYPDNVPAPGQVTAYASTTLTFANGVSTVSPNPASFTPSAGTRPAAGQPFVLAATGDGAGGEPEADAVIDEIASWNPNLFLYLGDVYESGTGTEFANWYGTGGERWSRFRAITNPTIGNHEYQNGSAPGYFDYWDNIPDYYSFDADGWHFVNLNSNDVIGQQPGSPQYEWLKKDLAANDSACTIAYFHHPLFNNGAQGSTSRMAAEWQLLAAMGVDVVLTGHDHNYQRWEPLDGAGSPDPTGMTEFVAGAGGHGVRPFTTNDSRMLVGYDSTPAALGALRFELGSDRASFEYVNTAGTVLDSGQIPCERSPYELGSPRHELFIARARLQRLLAVGAAPSGALSSAIGHLDKAEADALWASDWSPAAVKGEVVIDEMKKATNDLKPISGASPQLPTTITGLVASGQHLAEAAISEATTAYGALDAVSKARSLLGDGLKRAASGDPVGALDKYKQAFQAARDALADAPDSWLPGVGSRGRIGAVLQDLYGRYPSAGADAGRVEGALSELGKALDLALWRNESAPIVKDVFDHLKKAEDQLMGIKAIDVTSDTAAISAVARSIAVDAIDAAVARNGSAGKIKTARDKLAEADAKVAAGKYNEAMDRFRDAWLNALSA